MGKVEVPRNSVERLAAAHGIEVQLEVVARFLRSGLPHDSRVAVEPVWREELR
jgi:hypothetical protein